uniref:Uncharacterized protein n=1 Tax=Arundo donax TaxID=35708 RepID=A0A0A9B0V0_ARUDO
MTTKGKDTRNPSILLTERNDMKQYYISVASAIFFTRAIDYHGGIQMVIIGCCVASRRTRNLRSLLMIPSSYPYRLQCACAVHSNCSPIN